jgi:hypothetical protein
LRRNIPPRGGFVSGRVCDDARGKRGALMELIPGSRLVRPAKRAVSKDGVLEGMLSRLLRPPDDSLNGSQSKKARRLERRAFAESF